jgi:hypothetical protein
MTQPEPNLEKLHEMEGEHLPDDIRLYSQLEGLVGEEDALLLIPAHERSREQHHRLRAITEELDRMFERLHHRHARRTAPESSD